MIYLQYILDTSHKGMGAVSKQSRLKECYLLFQTQLTKIDPTYIHLVNVHSMVWYAGLFTTCNSPQIEIIKKSNNKT